MSAAERQRLKILSFGLWYRQISAAFLIRFPSFIPYGVATAYCDKEIRCRSSSQ